MPEVSIVTSTYNRSAMLPETMSSALGQRDVDLELIVVDNGSTDDTAAFLAAVEDPRVRVIRNEASLGATGGRNTGLVAATGEWLSVLDDDDLWAPDKLRAQLDAAQDAGASWAYTGCVYIGCDREILGGVPPVTPEVLARELPVRYVVPGGISNALWRRDVLPDGNLIDPQLTLTADWDITLRLLRTGLPAAVSRPLIGYRQHGRNLSRNAGGWQDEIDVVEAKFADLLQDRHVDRGAQQRFVASESLRSGHPRAAAAAYLRAVRLGDWGSIPRAASLLAPPALHPWLRRAFLSDNDWIAEAERWLHLLDAPSHAV